VATHFSRLLRHAWVTVGLFLFPGHHTGDPSDTVLLIYKSALSYITFTTLYFSFPDRCVALRYDILTACDFSFHVRHMKFLREFTAEHSWFISM
jgi:hypothetical protein